jgi:RimJ/RimL family protein N-acetyltransferase
MLLKSKRIYLRPLRGSDAAAVYAAVDASRTELDQFMEWSPLTTRTKDTADFIRRSISGRRQGTMYSFGVFDADSSKYIGNCGLHDIRRKINSVEIGYWIRSEYQRQGYATESAALVVRFAFLELRVHRVILRAASDNLGSIRVAEKLGFNCDGVQRHELHLSRGWLDYKYYCMLESEFQQQRARIEGQIRS